MSVARYGYNYDCRQERSYHHGKPFIGYEAEAVDEPYPGRDEEEPEVFDKKFRGLVDASEVQNTR